MMATALTRILVVEDEALIASDIELRLRKSGFDVPAVVDTGERAVTLAGELRPDLVLMDIRLKGQMGGIEAAGRIRRLYDIPVVYLTAHTDRDTLDRAKAAEPFGYLTKPLGGAALPGTIEVALYKHQLEGKLRQREAWLATTLRLVRDAVVVADDQGLVLFLNDESARLTGVRETNATGRPVTEVVRLLDSNAEGESPTAAARLRTASLSLPAGTLLRGVGDALTPVEGAISLSTTGERAVGTVTVFRNAERTPPERAISEPLRVAAS